MGFLQSLFGLGRKKKGPSSSSPAVEDDLAELRDLLAKLSRPSANEYELEMIMKEADADGDDFIKLAEHRDINGAGEGAKEVDLREAFAVFDKDCDGKISARELRYVLKGLGEKVKTEQCQKMIIGVDRDGDGMVSFQEFKVMMTGGGALPLGLLLKI